MSVNLFTIASNDQSVYYLGRIFGNIPGILPFSSNAPLLLGVLFKVLNTAALSVGAMIVTYTTVMGLLATASEGEFLGKKWSGLWVPIRTVLGIVGLFPSAGGYCAIQMIIMWLILQGVGLGDTLWTTTMQFLQKSPGGSPYAGAYFPDISASLTPQMHKLFTGFVCRESMNSNYEVNDRAPFSYNCTNGRTSPECGSSLPELVPDSGSYDLGFGCGTLTFTKTTSTGPGAVCSDPKSLACALAKAQVTVLPGIISVMDTIAQKFVQLDYEYQNFYYNSTVDTVNTTPEWIQSFCKEKNIKFCCANPKTPSGIVALALSSRGVASAASDCPAIFGKDSTYSPIISKQQPDSISSSVLTNVYIPYGLMPYLNGTDFIAAAMNQYMGGLTSGYIDYLAALPPPKLSGWQKKADDNGWILAGMFYYTIAKQDAAAQITIDNLPTFTVTAPTSPATIPSYRNNRDSQNMSTLFDKISKSADSNISSALGSFPGASGMGGIMKSFRILPAMIKDLTGSGKNPLYEIANCGYRLMYSTQITFFALALAVGLIAGAMSINFTVIGTGMTTAWWYEGIKALWGMFSPFILLMLATLYTIGAILGIYLPLIPYIIFTMGAVGWMMTTLEAMVAGPLIALGILSPSGQHELLGKAEPAVMILFNLILRPSLMVFGMMASMLVAPVVVMMINTGFQKVSFDIILNPGILESIAFMVVYVALLMMALNKVFSLIHVIPEKVLMYIGGQAISYGEGEALTGMKQALEGGAGAIAGAGKEAGGTPAAGATALGQHKAHRDAEAKRNAEADGKKSGMTATAASTDEAKGPPGS